jgi:hypothetical protein
LVNYGISALKDGWKPKGFGKVDSAMLAKVDATVQKIMDDLDQIATEKEWNDYM